MGIFVFWIGLLSKVLFAGDGLILLDDDFFNGSFLSYGLFSDFFLSSFFGTLAFAAALAFAFTLALTLTFAGVVAAGAGCQNLLCPVNDLVAVGSNDINGTGNSGQSGQNFQNDLHRNDLHNQM